MIIKKGIRETGNKPFCISYTDINFSHEVIESGHDL